MPSAWDITILETLHLLDDSLSEFSEGVADDRYAIWLGAGVSSGKLPGLRGVAEAVLEHVRARIDPANPACAFKTSLDRMLELVALDAGQRAAIDYAQPVAAWPALEQVTLQLVSRYAVMLDQSPPGEQPDYLVWNGVGVVSRYADPATTPGPEHLGLAALVAEGVASDCVSANWDDLIEKAMRLLDGPGSGVLQVRVLPADVQNNVPRARLYKFHGCAAKAGDDEGVYRDRIVGRQSQINGWAQKPENVVIAGKLVDLAISKPTLMLGLSAQDANIQDLFVRAQTQLPATFPTHPPFVMVSEDAVGAHQDGLLRNFYRSDYAAHAQDIQTASLVRSYAKSLLPALWLHVLCAKLTALIDKAAPSLPGAERDSLRQGIKRLRDLTAAVADPADQEGYIRAALAFVGRALRLFRRGRAPAAGEGIYAPLSDVGVTRTVDAPHVDTDGVVQLALAFALVGRGEQEGHWTCTTSDPAQASTGAVRLAGAVRQSEVFFAASAHAAAQLFASGHVTEDDDAVIVQSFEVVPRSARHPTSAPGRTGKLSLREFGVYSMADGAVSLDGLLQRFKAEVAV